MKKLVTSLSVLFFASAADALTLKANDILVLSQSGTESSGWNLKNRLIGKNGAESFDIVLGDPGTGGLYNIEYVKLEMDTLLISSYLSSGQSVSLPEPVTSVVLTNTANNLRAKLNSDSKFAAIYAANVEAKYYGAKSLLGTCVNSAAKSVAKPQVKGGIDR